MILLCCDVLLWLEEMKKKGAAALELFAKGTGRVHKKRKKSSAAYLIK